NWTAAGVIQSGFGEDDKLSHNNSTTSEAPNKVSTSTINTATWWTNNLFKGDNGKNWNINMYDAINPIGDRDPLDESSDDKQGTINQGYYPTVKEVVGTSSLDTEVREQVPELLDVPTTAGVQIVKDNNIVYPVQTDKITGLTKATSEQLNIYNSLAGADGIVTYDEVIAAGYDEYVLNPDEFVGSDSLINTSSKYYGRTTGFSFINTGVEWDYNDTNNTSYATEQSIERNPNILVDDITLKMTIKLPATYEITSIDVRRIASGVVTEDLGNMIGYITAPNPDFGMDIYLRIRPTYYYATNLDQYVVKSITYDESKDHDNNLKDDTEIILWNDANSNDIIDSEENYSDIYTVDGYGNMLNNDLDGNGVIDGAETSDGIADNTTADNRGRYKGVYTCKNTETNMSDYTTGESNIYLTLYNDYLNNKTEALDLTYTNNPLSSLDTMYYYGFSWNDIRYYNNGSSFALQRNINCEDADRDGVNVSTDGVSGDLDDIIAPIGKFSDYLYMPEYEFAANIFASSKTKSDKFIGNIDGQGNNLSNLNIGVQRYLGTESSGEHYGRGSGGLFSKAESLNLSNLVVNNIVLNNNVSFDSGYEVIPSETITNLYDGKYVYSAIENGESSNNNYEGLILDDGTLNLDNIVVSGVSLAENTEIYKLALTSSNAIGQTYNNLKMVDIDVQNYATSQDSTDNQTDKAKNIFTSFFRSNSLETTHLNNIIFSGNIQTDVVNAGGVLNGWQSHSASIDINNFIFDINFESQQLYPDLISGMAMIGGQENQFSLNNTYFNNNSRLNSNTIPDNSGNIAPDGENSGNIWNAKSKNYSELANTSLYTTWDNWDTTNVNEGNYPDLKSTWGMLMQQNSTKITDKVDKITRIAVENLQTKGEVQPQDTVDVSTIQQTNNLQTDIENLNNDLQDEVIKNEDEVNVSLNNQSNMGDIARIKMMLQ
ncbi:MAG: hypothetical protein ACK5HR_05215, partial [Mycoplasmatales bacterium]